VFFVISGFVIPYSLKRSGYKLRAYPTFILRRVVRLDPPYLITIVLLLGLAFANSFYSGQAPLVENAPIGLVRVLLHLGYLNMFFGSEWLNPSFWTLAIEFQYYLMMGLAFPLLSSRNRLVRVSALTGFAATAFFTGHHSSEGVPYSSFIFDFAFLFVMGIVTFQRYSNVVGPKEYAVSLLITAAGALPTIGIAPTLAGLLAVAVINLYNRKSLVARFFGDISYSLYLLHWPIGHLTLSLVGSKFLGATSDGARTLVLLFVLCVCLASAYVMYLFVEKPAQRWSASIRYGPAQSHAAP
jgi:peptidoglycan/LPS O-acetylase OafA/YrhL